MNYTSASGAEVRALVDRIQDVVMGEKIDSINMACLAIAVIFHCPKITGPQLAAGIKGASEWMALYNDSLENPVTNPKQVN